MAREGGGKERRRDGEGEGEMEGWRKGGKEGWSKEGEWEGVVSVRLCVRVVGRVGVVVGCVRVCRGGQGGRGMWVVGVGWVVGWGGVGGRVGGRVGGWVEEKGGMAG